MFNVHQSAAKRQLMIMSNIVADGRQRVLNVFLAVTICDTQVVQSLLQQVSVSTNAFASRLQQSRVLHIKGGKYALK